MTIKTDRTTFRLNLDDVAVMYIEKFGSWILRTEKTSDGHRGFYLFNDYNEDSDHKMYDWSDSWVSAFEVVEDIPDNIVDIIHNLNDKIEYTNFDDILEALPLDYEFFTINKEYWYLKLGDSSLIFFDSIIHFVNNTIILDKTEVKLNRKRSTQFMKTYLEYKTQNNSATISVV